MLATLSAVEATRNTIFKSLYVIYARGLGIQNSLQGHNLVEFVSLISLRKVEANPSLVTSRLRATLRAAWPGERRNPDLLVDTSYEQLESYFDNLYTDDSYTPRSSNEKRLFLEDFNKLLVMSYKCLEFLPRKFLTKLIKHTHSTPLEATNALLRSYMGL